MLDEQARIIKELGVAEKFDSATEADRRSAFLADYVQASSMRALVLGISRGVDSLTAGMLAQKAVTRLRDGGYNAEFIAVRLPYGEQADENDARKSLDVIRPDRTVTIDIKPAADAMMAEVRREADDLVSGVPPLPSRKRHGTAAHDRPIRAGRRRTGPRHRHGPCRRGTHGVLHEVWRRRGRHPAAFRSQQRRVGAVAQHLGAPADLVLKVPTADLESDAPLKPDEEVYGVTYDEIDDFLEGREIGEYALQRILTVYRATAHKRTLPAAPVR